MQRTERTLDRQSRDDLETPIDSLPLSNRTLRRLQEGGIALVGDLIARSDEDLLRVPGFGHTCLREVRAVLQVYRASGTDCLVDDSSAAFPRDLPDSIKDLRLVDLPIPNRARSIFQREHILTVRDYMKIGPETILAYKNFGAVTLADVNRAIHAAASALGEKNRLTPLLQVPRMQGEASDDADLSRVSIAALDLPRRARRACVELGIRTLRDFAGLDMNALLVRKNFGQATLRRIQREVERFLALPADSRSGFDGVLATLLARLQDKERRLVELREGGSGAAPKTLGEVGAILEITESRACQIEHSAWAKLRRFATGHIEPIADAVTQTLLRHGGLAGPEALVQHELFAVSEMPPSYLGRILAKLLPHHVGRLADGRLAAVPAATLCTLTARLRKRLRRGGGSQELAALIAETGRGLDLGENGATLVRALCENVFHREVTEDEEGSARVRTPSQALGDSLVAVLVNAKKPLHFTEIATRLEAAGDREAADAEKVRLRLCRDERFVLVGRGVYDLAHRFSVPQELCAKIAERAAVRLSESGRPTSVSLLHQILVEEKELSEVSEFVVAAVMREDARFRHLGRGTFALADMGNGNLAHVSDLLEKILLAHDGPLAYSDLRKRVQEQRRVSDGAISATLVGRETFLRVARGWFDLASRYPLSDDARLRLAGGIRTSLFASHGVAALGDLLDVARSAVPEAPFVFNPVLLGDLLRRIGGFRFVSGGFIQIVDDRIDQDLEQRALATLREAGEPMRPSSIMRRLQLSPAEGAVLRRVLKGSSRFEAHGDGRYGAR